MKGIPLVPWPVYADFFPLPKVELADYDRPLVKVKNSRYDSWHSKKGL